MSIGSKITKALIGCGIAAMVAACASIGHPEGGPRDEMPPRFVRSNPMPGTLNFNGKRLSLYFDENIKVEDVMNKVVISPVQQQTPQVFGNGHHISVELRDTLIPNTTYTIDFSDAIRDLNEGNILDGFAIDFSTGEQRDSLVISGMLLEARTLEPAQGMLVGVYSNLSDTAIYTLPMERIARTDQYGRFVIRNLAEGAYNLYAVNDLNRDYHWDRSEDVAFYGTAIVPSVETIEVTDTLRSAGGNDSISTRPGLQYLPNDLLLTWFNENYKAQYLKNYTRPDSVRLVIELGAPSDTFPQFTILNTDAAGERLDLTSIVEHNWSRDSIVYWLTNPAVIAADTLRLEARYQRTDSLDRLEFATDTLRLISRKPDKSDKSKKNNKQKNDSTTVPEIEFLALTPVGGNQQDLHKPFIVDFSQPIDTIIAEGIHFEQLVDTLWTPIPSPRLELDSLNNPLRYSLHHPWQPQTKYRLTVDSAAVVGIYGIHNKPFLSELTTKSLDDYSTITFNLSGYPDTAQVVVELLSSRDTPVARVAATMGAATFTYVAPGSYYARAFVDANGNGTWDTGNIKAQVQPEEMSYYPRKLDVKKNWDVSQSWQLDELPVDQQKPYAIKKNRPKTKEATPQAPDEENEEDENYNPFAPRPSTNKNNNRNNNSGFGGFNLHGNRGGR